MTSGPATGPRLPPRGVLGVPGRLPFTLQRWSAPDDLAWAVENAWATAWRLPAGRAVTARVLPHATVNLTLETVDGQRALVVTGVAAGVFSRTLRGADQAYGIKLSPGTYRLLSDVPPGRLSGLGQPALGVVRGAAELHRALLTAADDAERLTASWAWLRATGIAPDDTLRLVQHAHRLLVADPDVHRVTQAAERCGVSSRTLQRLFAEYLGVSPGWVLRRGRLHVAAERVIARVAGGLGDGAGPDEGFADLAAEFGYADQAHFSRDFRSVLGTAPGSWAAELAREHADA